MKYNLEKHKKKLARINFRIKCLTYLYFKFKQKDKEVKP